MIPHLASNLIWHNELVIRHVIGIPFRCELESKARVMNRYDAMGDDDGYARDLISSGVTDDVANAKRLSRRRTLNHDGTDWKGRDHAAGEHRQGVAACKKRDEPDCESDDSDQSYQEAHG